MKLKLGLKNKMQLFLISISVAIYVVAIGYISLNAKKITYNDAIDLVKSISEKNALNIQSDITEYTTTIRTLSQVFSVYPEMSREDWEPLFINMHNLVYKENPDFYKEWDSWELNKIDSTWNKSTGRISNVFSRSNGVITKKQDTRSLNGDSEMYGIIKSKAKELILPIYFDVYTDNNEAKKLMTSLIAPIKVNSEFHGMVGVDLILEKFQDMVNNIKLNQFSGYYSFLITQDGKYAGHPDTKQLNEVAQFTLADNNKFDITKNIQKGNAFTIITLDNSNQKHYVSFSPIKIGKTNTPWFLGVSVPINSIMAQADRNFMISILVGFIGILLLAFVIYIVSKRISDPIQDITDFLKKLAKGETNSEFDLNISSGDEIEEMSKALKTSIQGLNLKTKFADSIGRGDLDSDFELLSDKDHLGKALIDMRESLKQARKEEENRKAEDNKRRWNTEGLAKFADILRQNNDNISVLADEIIKNIVYYLEANQGGLFLINDDDRDCIFLELISAFAYDRKKYIDRRIEYGDGIVGATAIEKLTTYLEDIPEDYISITSGLGDANPTSLLVVPLKLEEKVYGVIEIASFKKIEKYQIEFVETVAQNIAATLSSVKTNIQTTELLEKFQQQSEEMAAQEEEMRQNMEELQATQEEAARKNNEMESLLHSLNKASNIIEYDPQGYIIHANENFLNSLKINKSDIIGIHHTDNKVFSTEQKENYDIFWSDLNQGKAKKEKAIYSVNGVEQEFIEVYTPIFNEKEELIKVMKISNSISDIESK